MLIDSEVERYQDQAPAILVQNVEAFLIKNTIERTELERFALRPFKGSFDSFYVSTVARGLAGSKSDVDLILVSDGEAPEGPTLSNMLFYAGRRVGVKLIKQTSLSESLAILKELSDRIAEGKFIDAAHERKRIGVKWQDLERLINGTSFNSGAKYLEYLPKLCRLTAVNMLQDFQRQTSFVRLAVASENLSAASAYAFGAVLSAMDAVMAICGQVQTNNKWTLERWQRFVPSVQALTAREAVAQVMEVRDALRPLIKPSDTKILKTLAGLQDFLWRKFMSPVQIGNIRFGLSDGQHRATFLPGADSICSPKIAAVVGTATLDALENAREPDFVLFNREVARDALKLLQAGVLSSEIVRSAV